MLCAAAIISDKSSLLCLNPGGIVKRTVYNVVSWPTLLSEQGFGLLGFTCCDHRLYIEGCERPKISNKDGDKVTLRPGDISVVMTNV